MRYRLTRLEIIVLRAIVVILLLVLVIQTGIIGLLFESLNRLPLDPGILATIKTGIVLLGGVLGASVLTRFLGGR